jgi:hypothetical protein
MDFFACPRAILMVRGMDLALLWLGVIVNEARDPNSMLPLAVVEPAFYRELLLRETLG